MAERAHDPRSLGIDQASPAVCMRIVSSKGSPQLAVPKLCQNPIRLGCRELLFEREQLPQVVDNKHFRMERMEHLEPVIVLRNQQVAGSIPAGGSIIFKHFQLSSKVDLFRTCSERLAELPINSASKAKAAARTLAGIDF